jgi:hypothetical protein
VESAEATDLDAIAGDEGLMHGAKHLLYGELDVSM